MAIVVKARFSPQPKCESETLILEREGAATCQTAIGQSNLVKSGQIWSNIQIWSKTGQRRGV